MCGGVAEYFGWDPDVVRVIWAITAVSTGIGIPAYIVATFLMDNRPDYVSRYDGDKKE